MNIQGLYYTEGVQGDGIIAALDKGNWSSVTDSINSRKYQHYGFTYNYKTRKIDEVCDPLPEVLIPLQQELTSFCKQHGLIDDTYLFNQCIVNDYQPGQGINKHTDIKAYGAVIGCYTFGSGAMMTFRNKDRVENIYVKPNSLYVMSGESRYLWTHEMPSRKSDMVDGKKILRDRRVSVTFRYAPK
jgi:alkylated DNA repair dioxygenase AlkB